MKCPSCEIDLTPTNLAGQTVDACLVCNGVWFDATELAGVLGQLNERLSLVATTTSNPPPASIACPRCMGTISPATFAHDSGIQILKCGDCDGVWLVNGQLEHLVQFRNGPHSSDRIAEATAGSSSESLVQAGLHSRWASLLFAGAVLTLVWVRNQNFNSTILVAGWLIIPLACIWFAGPLGNIRGVRGGLVGPAVSEAAPEGFVAFAGWILMLAGALVAVFAK